MNASLRVKRIVEVKISPNRLDLDQNGGAVQLSCFTSEDPSETEKVIWKHNKKLMSFDNRSISFVAKTADDAGNYSCQILDTNQDFESNIAVAVVKVGRENPPELEFTVRTVNDDHTFTCNVISYVKLTNFGIVRADIGTTAGFDAFPIKNLSNSIEAYISDVPESDGVYQCYARNQYGISFADIKIENRKK